MRGLEGRRVLVTGAGGFIGSHLTRALVAAGAECWLLLREGASGGRIADLLPRVTLVRGDTTQPADLERCFAAARPTLVFHLAGATTVRQWRGELEELVAGAVGVNLGGTLNLVLAAHRAGGPGVRVVRAGGLEEYGNGPAPYREEQRERPISPYSASQTAATHFCQMLQPHLACEVVTLRPALTYGPAQSEAFFIPALIRHCLAGEDFVMSSGDQGRDLVHVGDVVEAFLRAAVTPGLAGEVINVGTGIEHRLADVARTIVRLAGTRTELKLRPELRRVLEVEHQVCDVARAARLLGWSARTSLEDGLADTIAWYRDALAGASRGGDPRP